MREFDIVVAGAGAAGMVAALAAAHRGAHVALLERDAAERSNLAISGGLFAAAGTRWQRDAGVVDSPARFSADVRQKTAGTADAGVLDAVARHAARAAEFLADVAALPIHLHTASSWPGHSVARLHATPAESGAELCALLRGAVSRQPRIVLHDGAELVGLLPEGAELSAAGIRRRLAAQAVILATGGYGASPALVARFCPEAAEAVHVGGALSDGTALRVTEELRPALACMDAYQGQPHVSPHLFGGERVRFGAALPALGAVLVNLNGERFVAEDMGPSELTTHILAQPDGRAIEIWDVAAHQAAMAGGPFRRAVELGAVGRCQDLASLASAFGLPPDNLTATLGAAARCARGEAVDTFGRRGWGAPLVAPYFAAEVTGALAHTQGGLLVDGRARVLGQDGLPLPRLFAAGGAACGISGHGAAGYVPGNGLAQPFALGLLAGESASSR
jgi:fumarate reductase flavoprotein subunit